MLACCALDLFRRKKHFGNLAAIVIQCMYRGYVVRGSHKPALYQRQKIIRSAKIIIIQCQFRRFLHSKKARLKRESFTAAAINVQKCIRGFFGRKFVRRHKAAIVLQNSSKTFKDRRFFNMVMMVVQLRGVLRRRADACILIQKVGRGYMVRTRIYAERLSSLDRYHRAAVFITKLYGAFKRSQERKKKILKLAQREKMLRRLAQMIEELYFQRKDYQELVVTMQRCAPVMQAVVRGFIAVKATQRMKFLRKAMVTWCDPYYAKEFLSDFLTKLIPPPISTKTSVVSSMVVSNQSSIKELDGGQGEGYLSQHIPLRRGRRQDYVDFPTLAAALQRWYVHCRKPLLPTEVTFLYARFRNPNNSRVHIPEIDDYIGHHEEPCRKHARTICGECVYFRECHFGKCECKEFKKDKRTGLVCLHCNHPMSHHKLLPLAMNPAKKRENASLLSTLNTVLKPDLSLPSTVKGVDVDKVADQITKHHSRSRKEVEMLDDFNTASAEGTLASKSTLSASISALEVTKLIKRNLNCWWLTFL